MSTLENPVPLPDIATAFRMCGTDVHSPGRMVMGYFLRHTHDGHHVILSNEDDEGTVSKFIVDRATLRMVFTGDESMDYTPEQFADVVDEWERIVACASEGKAQGHYQYSHVHLSQTPSWPHTYPMPTRDMIGALVLSDGAETSMPRDREDPSTVDSNPYVHGDTLYPIELTLISCGDYHGSELDAANNRTLNGHPGVTVREPNTGGMGSIFNVSEVNVGETSPFANQQGDPAPSTEDALMWMRSLANMLGGLTDYPVLNDETLAEYEQEVATDAWDSWLSSDIRDELAELCPLGPDDFPVLVRTDEHYARTRGKTHESCEDAHELVDVYMDSSGECVPWHSTLDSDDTRRGLDGDDAVRDAYYSYEGNDWVFESATSIVNGRHEDAVKHVARTVFLWEV